MNEKTINYITKYMYKKDEKHPNFTGKVLCSSGIGSGYLKRADSINNRYKEENTKEYYKLKNGAKLNLPIYYKNKIYTEKEKELLWIQKLNKGEVYVMGVKLDINDQEEYKKTLEYYQEHCQRIHGDNPQEWEIQKYINRLEKQRLAVMKMKRCKKCSSKKDQSLSSWINAENTYNKKYKQKSNAKTEKYNEYEYLTKWPS